MCNVRLLILTIAMLATACGAHRSGAPGVDGLPGAPGVGCSVQDVVNGAIITCGPDSVLILDGTAGIDGQNGTDGQDGQDAPPTAYTVTELVDPCGDGPGFDEVIFRLANGQLVAHYAGGGNLQFLALLGPGAYRTTDSQACNFTVGPAPTFNVTF